MKVWCVLTHGVYLETYDVLSLYSSKEKAMEEKEEIISQFKEDWGEVEDYEEQWKGDNFYCSWTDSIVGETVELAVLAKEIE